MGILKGCLKMVGTAALAVTGTASTVLKGMSDSIGMELGSELFGAAKDASFNGIRSIWSESENTMEVIDKAEEISYGVEDATRRNMAETAYKMAQMAKQKGDMEKYETYMEKYHELR